MLKILKIENIAVIESAEIEFSEGLNILTGETGAGKSIVVDAINAILGERTSKELVRSGAEYAFVSAYFENVGSDAEKLLEEMDIESSGDGTLLITRKINAAGKSSCKINGCPATASMLKKAAAGLVNIHGQHDSQALLNPQRHGAYLDMLSKNPKVYADYRESFHKLISVRRQLKALALDEDSKDRQLELLNYQIKELEQADIRVGERQELLNKKALFDSSGEIMIALEAVRRAILGHEDSGVLGVIADIKGALSSLKVTNGETEKMLSLLEDAGEILQDVGRIAEKERDNTYFDDAERDNTEARLDELFTLGKKYGDGEEAMLAFLDDAVKKRDAILYSDEELERLNAEYDRCYEDAVQKAAALTAERQKTAAEFEKAVKGELRFLEMPKISFKVNFEKGNLSSSGVDKIEFLISANPGEAEKPLSKIASGGELSRIMLAFKNILARTDTIGTLIFDEIDTGVSGKASGKIGLKLKSVSNETQVIAVTHSAQIAACADRHLLIEKEFARDKTYTKVTPLGFDERAAELARIMGGLQITDSLLQSARELLQNSAGTDH